jgi:hypothetical protein
MRAVLIILMLLTTTGFTSCGKRETIRIPGPVEYRDRIVVEPIAPELLREHPIATGPIAVCPQVAAARRFELEACNADKAALRAQQDSRRD